MERIINRSGNKSEIQEFFSDLNVFLTGGTGVVGQVLLEKILRSCPIQKLYVLVRERKNKSPETKIKELFAIPLFDRLRTEQPEFAKKVVLVLGDCEKPDLGMSENDKAELVANINVVIHCAATVNFNERLKRATFVNIRSTRDLLIIARQMSALKAFVYVSTAYSNCNQELIKEQIYNNHIQGDTLIKMAETMSDSFIDSITDKCLGSWPNTYTLSKCIAENIVQQYGTNMPVCITRPSIVISTCKEPVPGWANNLVGINGMTAAVAMGAVHVLLFKDNIDFSLVPSDKVVNLIISSAWHIGVSNSQNTIPVYNYVSCNMAPKISSGSLVDIIKNTVTKNKLFSKNQIWYPSVYLIQRKSVFTILFFILHYIPAFFADIYLRLSNHKLRAINIYKRTYKLVLMLAPFTLIGYSFEDGNVINLISCQTDKDKVLFDMNLTNLDWKTYFENCIRGGILFILKEKSAKPDLGTWRRTFVLHYGLLTILAVIMFYSILFIFNSILSITNLSII